MSRRRGADMAAALLLFLLRADAAPPELRGATGDGVAGPVVAQMGIYKSADCAESSLLEHVSFVEDAEDPRCWAMQGEASWGFASACQGGVVSIHAFEARSCNSTPMVFLTGVPYARAVAFFEGTGCEAFQPEPGLAPQYGKLGAALPSSSSPECVGSAVVPRKDKPPESGASRLQGAPRLLVLCAAAMATAAVTAV